MKQCFLKVSEEDAGFIEWRISPIKYRKGYGQEIKLELIAIRDAKTYKDDALAQEFGMRFQINVPLETKC